MASAAHTGDKPWPYVVVDGGTSTGPRGGNRMESTARACAPSSESQRTLRALPGANDCLLVGISDAMQAVRDDVARVARSNCDSVLITGETGTGKEIVARELHRMSHDPSAPFLAVSCPAIPDTLAESDLFGHVRGSFTGATGDRPGYFSLAHGGTLFLDEVGDLSPNAQAVLLRVLETRTFRPVGSSREVTVRLRVVAATNVELDGRPSSGKFRQDLYYRLNVFRIHLPPLRERVEDILPLADHFLAQCANRGGSSASRFSPSARNKLLEHSYPGNARELRALVERALIRCDDAVIEPKHLAILGLQERSGPPIRKAQDRRAVQQQVTDERAALLLAALERARWNRRRAAAELGIPYSTFRYRLLRLGIR